MIRFLLPLAVVLVLAPGMLPTASAHAQDRAQELVHQQTGLQLGQEEILRRLAESGLTRTQARSRFRAQGLDPSIVDPYYDRLEGREATLPEVDADVRQALARIGIVVPEGDRPPTVPVASFPTPSTPWPTCFGPAWRTAPWSSTACPWTAPVVPPPDNADFALDDLDELVVYARERRHVPDSVHVVGEVKEPGTYPLAEGTNVEDVILAAGGFERGVDLVRAELARPRVGPEGTETVTVSHELRLSGRVPYPNQEVMQLPDSDRVVPEALPPADEFRLLDDDRSFVRRLPGYERPMRVQVEGDRPGEYAPETWGERVSDVLRRAGGPTESAYLQGFRLILLAFDPTVRIEGAVAFDTRVLYRDGLGLRDYLEGGETLTSADESRSTVEYPDGERALVKRRQLMFTSRPRVEPGSTIHVPVRPEAEEGVNWDEVLNRTLANVSTTATLLIAIDRF